MIFLFKICRQDCFIPDDFFLYRRTLGTPDEESWPGVTELPDYKKTFPKWPRQSLASIVKNTDESGIELLEVSCNGFMLAYLFILAHVDL
jgi:hypothetical protein